MLEFDPNNKKPKTFEWATYIPSRSTQPKFKGHTTRAHCLSAFTHGRVGIAYHWENDEWVEVFRREKDSYVPTHCEICGADLTKHGTRFGGEEYTYNQGNWSWINKDKFFPDPIRICYSYTCRKACK